MKYLILLTLCFTIMGCSSMRDHTMCVTFLDRMEPLILEGLKSKPAELQPIYTLYIQEYRKEIEQWNK